MPTRIVKRQVDKKSSDSMQAHWSKKQKYEAVVLYKSVGNLAAVGRTLGIPYATLKVWKDSDWFKEVSNEIATEMRTKRSKRLDRLIEKATDLIEDNLTHGEWIYRNDQLVRKPVNTLTAAKVLNTAFDKQIVLEKLALEEKQVQSVVKTEERLQTLFSEFQKFARAKEIKSEPETAEGGDPESTEPDENPDVQDVEVIDPTEDEPIA